MFFFMRGLFFVLYFLFWGHTHLHSEIERWRLGVPYRTLEVGDKTAPPDRGLRKWDLEKEAEPPFPEEYH